MSTVRVVIPTLYRGPLLDAAIASVDGANVVVADGTDGFVSACNAGAAGATEDYLLLLNDDAELEPGGLDALVAAADADSHAAIWQPVVLRPDGRVESAGHHITRAGFLWHLRGYEHAEVFSALGACMLVRRDAFERLGGFAHDYTAYFEETDLCWRAKLAGYEVRCLASVTCIHRSGTTTARRFASHEVHYLAYRNRWRSILANASGRTLATMAPLHALSVIAIAVAFAATGKVRDAKAIVRALAWPVRNREVMRSQRRGAQSLRRMSDADVLRPMVPLTAVRALQLLKGNLGRWR